MPLAELDILSRETRTAAVRAFKYPDLAMTNYYGRVPAKQTDGADAFHYDIYPRNRSMAKASGHEAPTRAVAVQAIGAVAGKCISVREHKMLNGNRMLKMRQPGATDQDMLRVEEFVAGEQGDLARRDRMLKEFNLAQMFTGSCVVNVDGVALTINYRIPTANKAAVSASWALAATKIISDLKTMKRTAARETGYDLSEAWCSSVVMDWMLQNTQVQTFLAQGSDRGVQLGEEGRILRLGGFNWHEYDHGYENDAGTFVPFVAEDRVILTPTPEPTWLTMFEGSSMVHDPAAERNVEVFGEWSWIDLEKDPAGYKLLHGDVFIWGLLVPAAVWYPQVIT